MNGVTNLGFIPRSSPTSMYAPSMVVPTGQQTLLDRTTSQRDRLTISKGSSYIFGKQVD